jgi:uncharacterized protein
MSTTLKQAAQTAILVFVIAVIALGTTSSVALSLAGRPLVELVAWTSLLIGLTAFACEYVDSTLGMGYGTVLTPLLMFVGYSPLDIVPAVLTSELCTGLLAAALHHRAGNADFRRGGDDLPVAMILAVCSVVGTIVAVIVAVRISKAALTYYIGSLVLAMGVIILVLRGREARFSWAKVVGLGLLASFNKGMSGGGYGPVVTCGQIISGIQGKRAVAITSLAEGLTCAVGIVTFLLVRGGMNVRLTVALTLGAVCAVPFSAYSVSRVDARRLTVTIGVVTVILGLLALTTQTFKP